MRARGNVGVRYGVVVRCVIYLCLSLLNVAFTLSPGWQREPSSAVRAIVAVSAVAWMSLFLRELASSLRARLHRDGS